MRWALLGIVLVGAAALPLGACLAFTDLSGLSRDAPGPADEAGPSDAASDTFGGDRPDAKPTSDASTRCNGNANDVFCDDFDEGGLPRVRWDRFEQGSAQVDLTASDDSPPRALSFTLANSATGDYPKLTKEFLGSFQSLTCSFGMLVAETPSVDAALDVAAFRFGGAGLLLRIYATGNERFALGSCDGNSNCVSESSSPDIGARGRFHAVKLALTPSDLSFFYDGTKRLTVPVNGVVANPSSPTFTLGVDYRPYTKPGAGSWKIALDTVVCERIP